MISRQSPTRSRCSGRALQLDDVADGRLGDQAGEGVADSPAYRVIAAPQVTARGCGDVDAPAGGHSNSRMNSSSGTRYADVRAERPARAGVGRTASSPFGAAIQASGEQARASRSSIAQVSHLGSPSHRRPPRTDGARVTPT
jgi:hypothetical protein